MAGPVLASTSYILAVAGGTLLVAFGADVVARRLGFPDILLLLGVGVLVGPILHLAAVSTLLTVAPYLGMAALALILFDAGMDLRHYELGQLPSKAALLAVLAVALSFLVTFPVAYYYLTGRSGILALLFAGALSCTSSAVVVPVASRMSLPSDVRSLVHVSSALEDVSAVILVTTFMLVAQPSSSGLPLVALVVLPLPIGVAGGVLGGLLWLEVTRRWQARPYFSMATVGFLFGLVGIVQALGGAGILSALILGVIMGNAEPVRAFLRPYLRWEGEVVLTPQFRQFHSELAYVLRAFFMLVLGMLMVFGSGYESLLLVGALIAALLLVARASSVEAFLRLTHSSREGNLPLVSLSARGLTNSVLVILPVTAGLIPSMQAFLDPTLIVVVISVAFTSGGVLLYERVPSIHSGRFGERPPPLTPLSPEEKAALYQAGRGTGTPSGPIDSVPASPASSSPLTSSTAEPSGKPLAGTPEEPPTEPTGGGEAPPLPPGPRPPAPPRSGGLAPSSEETGPRSPPPPLPQRPSRGR